MADDRELVERLAAIDATPRASWVAALRADLDAAWESGDAAGYLDSMRATTEALVDREPRARESISGGPRPTLIAVAALVLVVVGALVVSRFAETGETQHAAAPPVGNGLIAFVGESDDNPETSEIYVAAPDGTGLRALTSTPELIEYAPAWSPDGSRLAFVRNHSHISSTPCLNGCQLVVVDPATGVEMFSADIPQPDRPAFDTWVPWSLAWSPDGRAIAVQSHDCGSGGCGGDGVNSVIADLETGAFTTFTPPYGAMWSPDGEWLSLTQGPTAPGPSMLLLVPAGLIGTGDVVDVAALVGARPLLGPGDGSASVAWMPDGSALVVTDETGIDVVTIADGERRTLIEDGFDPVVSPDGTQIAYKRGDGDLNEIWVAAANGSNPRRVTASLTDPAWSPDGSLLLAEDYQGEFTVRPDGTDRTTLGIRDHTRKLPIPLVFAGSGIDWQPAGAHER